MEAINIFSAENLEGGVDVAGAVGSAATLMFIYDLAPGRSSSPVPLRVRRGMAAGRRRHRRGAGPMGSTPGARRSHLLSARTPLGPTKLMNRSESPARALMFSSSRAPAVSVYPDSDKILVGPGDERRTI